MEIEHRLEAVRWSMVVESLTRPYAVSLPMIVFVLLVPFYIFIAEVMPGRTLHAPELALDRVVPVYTRQHCILDVIAGIFLACLAYVIFLRPREEIPEFDRRLALTIIGIINLAFACYWVAYKMGVE
jgi:hypothetical protein